MEGGDSPVCPPQSCIVVSESPTSRFGVELIAEGPW
jgi:hypothetical protein